MIRTALLLLVTLILLPKISFARDPITQAFKQAYPQVQIESVKETDIPGIYEVASGNNIFYFVPETNYLIFGEILSPGGVSLTAGRRNQLIARRIKSLPLESAVKIGASGGNVVIEITDPDCPFCREVSDFFAKRDHLTRYVFFLPLTRIHPDSEKKARYILCAEDSAVAYEEVMSGKLDGADIKLTQFCKEKSSPLLAMHMEVSKKLGVKGTPTLWVNGNPIYGANIPLIEKSLKKGGALTK